MRILYVTSSYPCGVGEAFLHHEIQAVLAAGVTLYIVPMYPRTDINAGVETLLAKDVIAEPLWSLKVLRCAILTLVRRPMKTLFALRLILTAKPLLLLKNLAVFPKGLWLANLARHLQVDHIHVHWAATTASMVMVASFISKIPWSVTAHRWDIVENNLLQRKARRATFFRCISHQTQRMALERGVPANKTRIICMGVSIPPLPRCKPARSQFIVLCPAAFQPVKGHRYLIEALRMVPENVHLWCAGDGPERPKMEALARRLGLQSRVRFLGALSHSMLLSLYEHAAVDAVAMASLDLGNGLHEGIPVSLLEAMAFGYPVIATTTGGIPELVVEGTGLLVPQKSASALAQAIRAVAQNPALSQSLGSNARSRVIRNFSAQAQAATLIECWRSVPADTANCERPARCMCAC